MELVWVDAEQTTSAIIKPIESTKEVATCAVMLAVSDTDWGVSVGTECLTLGFSYNHSMIILGGGPCRGREDGKKKCIDFLKKTASAQILFWSEYLGENN